MGNKLQNAYQLSSQYILRKVRRKRASSCLPLTCSVSISSWQKGLINRDVVTQYMLENPDFLDEFIMKHSSSKRMLEWSKTQLELKENHVKQDAGQHCEFDLYLQLMYEFVPLFLAPKEPLLSEVERMMTEIGYNEDNPPLDIEDHLFSCLEIPKDKLNFVFMYMIEKLCGNAAFPKQEFACFMATVQANYFDQPYHNYNHAMCHAQSMYWILRNSLGVFSDLEMKILMIAALCHDIGHPGFGEAFTKCAIGHFIYDVPTLEQYHTQTLYAIIFNKQSNIFSSVTEEEFMEVVHGLRMCILSTYVNEFAQRLQNLRKFLRRQFDIEDPVCRKEVKRVLMVICDFGACWKSWDVHKTMTRALYEEFHEQGEKMEKMGSVPPQEYLKKNANEIPRNQISFLENLMLPLFREAAKIFPVLSQAIERVEDNKNLWMRYL